ncbi:MAG: fructosamine kinase family protein [Gammaproteobacteria bacterium]|nr:fructosamine kinase family protein [Gammaproteobacteria bacterium]
MWDKIAQQISKAVKQDFEFKKQFPVFGGDINQASQVEGLLEGEPASFFIKLNKKNLLGMFEAEAAGLGEIDKSQSIYVPHVICHGVVENQSFLILENLQLGSGNAGSAARLGQQLAQMHKTTANQFGWVRENTIGSTRQVNSYENNWIDFWRKHRLGFQLELANTAGCSRSLLSKGQKLNDRLEAFFNNYEPEASLLHGDLWSGNYAYLKNAEPVIYDPAIYYGDREADIAMTELFGGFSTGFYAAYNEAWPLDQGYQQRKRLYNLYHVLNHYNLFGGGYGMQAENMIDQLLASV